MFLQYTRKCWMKQYVHFGFEFSFNYYWALNFYFICSHMPALKYLLYLFSLSGSRSHCAGKGPFILWREVIVFSQHTVEEPFVFNVFLLQVRAVLIRFGSQERLRKALLFYFVRCLSRWPGLVVSFPCMALLSSSWLQMPCMHAAC